MTVDIQVGAALRYGWRAFRENMFFFVGMLLLLVIPLVLLETRAVRLPQGTFEYGLVKLVAGLWRIASAMAVILVSLDVYDAGRASMEGFRRIGSRYVPYIVGSLIYSLLVGIGMILLVIPGLYIAVICQFTPYLIIDRKLGPIESLKESTRLTKGSRWGLLLFGLVMLGLNFVGSILFGIGLLVTLPVTICAHVWVYRRFVPVVV